MKKLKSFQFEKQWIREQYNFYLQDCKKNNLVPNTINFTFMCLQKQKSEIYSLNREA